MKFFIYCPCKVQEIGLELIKAATFPGSKVFHYMLYLDIIEKLDPGRLGRSKCSFCGAFVRIFGRDPIADQAIIKE